ncbi:MAG: hypothetical protein R6U98_16065, partial [Pirellulaceae bacterium]
MAKMIPMKVRTKREPVLMREQSSEVRVHNFNEVPLGYSKEEAIKEAQRCLQCKQPKCMKGCPAEIN